MKKLTIIAIAITALATSFNCDLLDSLEDAANNAKDLTKDAL